MSSASRSSSWSKELLYTPESSESDKSEELPYEKTPEHLHTTITSQEERLLLEGALGENAELRTRMKGLEAELMKERENQSEEGLRKYIEGYQQGLANTVKDELMELTKRIGNLEMDTTRSAEENAALRLQNIQQEKRIQELEAKSEVKSAAMDPDTWEGQQDGAILKIQKLTTHLRHNFFVGEYVRISECDDDDFFRDDEEKRIEGGPVTVLARSLGAGHSAYVEWESFYPASSDKKCICSTVGISCHCVYEETKHRDPLRLSDPATAEGQKVGAVLAIQQGSHAINERGKMDAAFPAGVHIEVLSHKVLSHGWPRLVRDVGVRSIETGVKAVIPWECFFHRKAKDF